MLRVTGLLRPHWKAMTVALMAVAVQAAMGLLAVGAVYEGVNEWSQLTVGAVCDRAYFVDFEGKRAVIDRAYSGTSAIHSQLL
jgi:hypothetical protein